MVVTGLDVDNDNNDPKAKAKAADTISTSVKQKILLKYLFFAIFNILKFI
jgi:hypothetical protein